MRSLIISLILAVLLIITGIWHQSKYEAVASELIDSNEKVIERLKYNDFAGAMAQLNTFSDDIEHSEKFFSAMGNHDELDSIELCLASLRGYTQGEQKYDALSEAYSMLFLLEHLPKNARLRSENIF